MARMLLGTTRAKHRECLRDRGGSGSGARGSRRRFAEFFACVGCGKKGRMIWRFEQALSRRARSLGFDGWTQAQKPAAVCARRCRWPNRARAATGPDALRSASVFTLASHLGTAGELQFSARLHVDPLGQPSVVPIDADLPRSISSFDMCL
ncbi:hypothetical protein L1887_46926 [Cichorium endivia]|nr:hypothetical protein L1887_46926 [Cichorium endivia]